MDPKANPPGYWKREIAQSCRDTAARLTRIADDLEAEAEKAEQEALAREQVPDGSYGGAR